MTPDGERELSIDVAREIMGWFTIQSKDSREWNPNLPALIVEGDQPYKVGRTEINKFPLSVPWSPSTSIADAWDVVEKMSQMGSEFELQSAYIQFSHIQGWRAEFQSVELLESWGDALAPTAPEAICRAALAYVRKGK